jgi:pimeloyl-ACP methyl ester carboxylesterase
VKQLTLLTSLGLCLSCAPLVPRVGQVVSPGVGQAEFETRANGTDLVSVTVIYPARDDGTPQPRKHPAVVFVPGGAVPPSRYEWQAIELAKAGYVVGLARYQLDLALFSVNFGQAVRTLFIEPPPASLLEGIVDRERIAVAGHSLGSVVAMKLALQGNFQAVVLEAGFPDSADDAQLPQFRGPSLSLAGALDCSAKLSAVRAGWNKLPAPTALTVLEGVTHYQFTDSQTEDEQRKCLPTVDLGEAHARIASALISFLDSALRDGRVGTSELEKISGATVEAR